MNKPSPLWLPVAVLAVAALGAMPGCASFPAFDGVHTLRGSDAATTDQAPEAKPYAGKRPGSGQPIVRTFKEQPPLVPHAIDNFDEITLAENQCLECHSPATAKAKNAPRVGERHLTATSELRMDRYQCNTCHVPQVDAKPLVASTFSGTALSGR